MPYTLVKALVWLVLALLLGIVLGWLLRNATARRQIARARNERGDAAEIERLRTRSEQLDTVVAERDRLTAELVACRNERDRLAGAPPDRADDTDAPTDVAPPPDESSPIVAAAPEAGTPAPPERIEGADAVLGRELVADDLKAIEGIGPKVEELCHGIGIRTWRDMAGTEVSLLRTMLTDAGARYKVHDPSTWPEQARLLAEGRWSEFHALTERLHGGAASS